MLSRQRQEEVQINAISSGVSKTFRKSHRMSGLDAEMRSLQVKDIDSRSMLIHIQPGKGGRDPYVPLSATLLDTLRAYWRWMKPKTWLFPGTIAGWRADKPLTPKVVWDACKVLEADGPSRLQLVDLKAHDHEDLGAHRGRPSRVRTPSTPSTVGTLPPNMDVHGSLPYSAVA
jgi:integrase